MANEEDVVKVLGTIETFGRLLGVEPAALIDRLNRGRIECSHTRVTAAGSGFPRRRPPATVIQPSKAKTARE
jgi:hypothetical protein